MAFSEKFIADGFETYIKKLYDNEGAIHAIKLAKDMLDINLIDAKHYVEELCENEAVRLTVVMTRREALDFSKRELSDHACWIEPVKLK